MVTYKSLSLIPTALSAIFSRDLSRKITNYTVIATYSVITNYTVITKYTVFAN